MRSLFKLSLASLAAIALFAGMAFAQTTPKFSGNVGAAFGQFSYGDIAKGAAASEAFSEYTTSWESNLRMTMETDKLTAIVRYRARASIAGSGSAAAAAKATCEDDGTDTVTCSTTGGNALTGNKLSSGTAFNSNGNDIYHEIWWKPADNFSIGFGKFQGQAWSQPLGGTYLVINPIGDGEYWMNWTGVPGIDFEFNAGVVQVGLAISSQCKPSCAFASVSGASARTAQSMVPHVAGKVGDIAFRAQLPSTSQEFGDSDSTDKITLKGSGAQFGVSWAGMPGVAVAFDYATFTDPKDSKIATAAQDDRKRSSINLRVDAAGVTFGYFQMNDNGGAKEKVEATGTPATTTSKGKDGANTTLTLRYTLPMGSGQIIPEYRSQTFNKEYCAAIDDTGKCATLTNSEFRLIGNVNY